MKVFYFYYLPLICEINFIKKPKLLYFRKLNFPNLLPTNETNKYNKPL